MIYISRTFLPSRQRNQAMTQWDQKTDEDYEQLLAAMEQEAIGVVTGIIGNDKLAGMSTDLSKPLIGSYIAYTLFNGTEYQDWADAYLNKFEMFLTTLKETRSGSRLKTVYVGCKNE